MKLLEKLLKWAENSNKTGEKKKNFIKTLNERTHLPSFRVDVCATNLYCNN